MKYNAAWRYNSALLYNAAQFDQTIYTGGLESALFGLPSVADSDRYITGASVGDVAQVGPAPVLTHWLQYARPQSLIAGAIGDPAIGESPRTVSPPWWYSTVFGHAWVGEYLTVSPTGMIGEVGRPTVIDTTQRVQHYGAQHFSAGTPLAELDDRVLTPLGVVHTRMGVPEMVPMLRTVLQSNTTYDPGVGLPTLRLMTFWPEGIWPGGASDRVTVSRSGDVLNPASLDAGARGQPMVSHFERTLALGGFESLAIERWHHARNDARLLWPTGFPGAIGLPSLVNTLRTLLVTHAPGPEIIGTAWADRAERTVRVSYGIDSPLGGTPRVQLWEQYIAPAGYQQVETGGHSVEPRQNRLIPPGFPQTLWGTAGIVNEDREIRPAGVDAGPRGLARLFRDPEQVTATGLPATLFGHAQVMDSTRTVRAAFAGAGGFIPETHWLRKELPDPPVNQVLQLDGIGNNSPVGTPLVRTNWIYGDGWQASSIGNATVAGNGIRPAGIPPPGFNAGGPVGVPFLPSVQYVRTPDSMAFGGIGEPRMTPHYIFAPRGNGGGELIDQWLHGQIIDRPVFGAAAFTHEVRTVQLDAFTATLWGQGEVQGKLRTLRPVGMRLFRPGYPMIRGAGDIDAIGFDAALWGDVQVARPLVLGDQTVRPLGLAGEIGDLEAQNQHRTIDVTGINAGTFGTQWASYQYDPFTMGGFVATLAGEPLVEYADREIYPEAFEALDMTPFPGWSGDRMRVRPVSFVAVAGSAHSALGTPVVEQQHRTVGVNGIERPQIQVPEGGRVRGESQLAPDGLDAGVLGAPRMWEPGDDLYPYAEDMLSLGTARLIGVLQPSGFEALLTGDIRFSRPVEPAGDELTDWGAAVVSHDGGGRICNSHYALAIALAAMDAGTFGAHGVAHD